MTDWLSYSLTDLLPFSRETYLRLAALYNARFVEVVVVGAGLGVVVLASLWRDEPGRQRAVLGLLGLSWLWIAWAYQLETLAPLLWAGEVFALAFALQSGLLLAAAIGRAPSPSIQGRAAAGWSRWVGYGGLAFAVSIAPMIELATGRPWHALGFFGSAADPTAMATLGVAAMLDPRLALPLVPVPLLWCLISALLRLGLGDPLGIIPALAMALALVPLWRLVAERTRDPMRRPPA